MPGSFHIPIRDGVLQGRRPPTVIRVNIAQEAWRQLRRDLYEILHSAVRFQRSVFMVLMGFFAIPVVSFAILLGLVKSGLVELQEETQEEDAFQFLLFTTAGGCLGLSLICLIVASIVRISYMDVSLVTQMKQVVDDCEKDAKGLSMHVIVAKPHCLRRFFLAWCDVNFFLVVTKKDGTLIEEPSDLEEADDEPGYKAPVFDIP